MQHLIVPTRVLFASDKLKKDSPVRTFDELLHSRFDNCFTPVVVNEYPQVKELLDTLSEFGTASMSGSGSSCFVAFDSYDHAKCAQMKIDKLNIKSFIAKSVSKSPVLSKLESL